MQKVKHEVWESGYLVLNDSDYDVLDCSKACDSAEIADEAILKVVGEAKHEAWEYGFLIADSGEMFDTQFMDDKGWGLIEAAEVANEAILKMMGEA